MHPSPVSTLPPELSLTCGCPAASTRVAMASADLGRAWCEEHRPDRAGVRESFTSTTATEPPDPRSRWVRDDAKGVYVVQSTVSSQGRTTAWLTRKGDGAEWMQTGWPGEWRPAPAPTSSILSRRDYPDAPGPEPLCSTCRGMRVVVYSDGTKRECSCARPAPTGAATPHVLGRAASVSAMGVIVKICGLSTAWTRGPDEIRIGDVVALCADGLVRAAPTIGVHLGDNLFAPSPATAAVARDVEAFRVARAVPDRSGNGRDLVSNPQTADEIYADIETWRKAREAAGWTVGAPSKAAIVATVAARDAGIAPRRTLTAAERERDHAALRDRYLPARTCPRCGYWTCGGSREGAACETIEASGAEQYRINERAAAQRMTVSGTPVRGLYPWGENVADVMARANTIAMSATRGLVTPCHRCHDRGYVETEQPGTVERCCARPSDDVVRLPITLVCVEPGWRTRALAFAFAALASHLDTPRGRRLVAVETVELAVARCPKGLHPGAYRAALMAHAERRDWGNRGSAYMAPEHIAAACTYQHPEGAFQVEIAAYRRALTVLTAPPRPARAPSGWQAARGRGRGRR